MNQYRGPGFLHPHLCKNTEDFLYMTEIQESDPLYFFSYKDSQDCIWYFDVRSFLKLYQTNKSNPYTREEIPKNVKIQFTQLLQQMKKRKLSVEIEDTIIQTLEDKVKHKLIDVSVNMSQCGFQFHKEWVSHLDIPRLIKLFCLLEDMWNYRAELTREMKRRIIPPTGIVFNYPVGLLKRLRKKEEILNILLDDILKFENSLEEGNRKLGYIYLLICLKEFVPECSLLNPWIQWT